MPATIRLTDTYTDRGEVTTIQIDFVGIPLKEARIANAGVAGTLSNHQGRERRLEEALAAITDAIASYRLAARLVSRTPDEVVFEVTKS